MRIGFNPNKDKTIAASDFFHQIVIPIHIPNFEGYFQDSFQIFKYCMESLFKTSHSKTYFTVINNGSCTEVVEYLDQLYSGGKIHELMHTNAIGKLNSVLKGLTGHNFPLITITDADVLFLNNWQKSTYEIFETFPKAGAVSTTPNPKMLRYFTSNILFDHCFSKQLAFTKVKNPNAVKAFADSIGTPDFYNEVHLDKNLTISKGNVRAVIGAGHFVATYRGIVFNDLSNRFSIHSLGGNSENDILDKPVVNQGYWRLSTENNFTFHMGNKTEDWMLEEIEKLTMNDVTFDLVPQFKKIHVNPCFNKFKTDIFSRLLFRKPIWKMFLIQKGLSKEEAEKY